MTSGSQAPLRVRDLDLDAVVPEAPDGSAQALVRPQPLSWRDAQLERTAVAERVFELDQKLTRGARHAAPSSNRRSAWLIRASTCSGSRRSITGASLHNRWSDHNTTMVSLTARPIRATHSPRDGFGNTRSGLTVTPSRVAPGPHLA